MTIYEFNPGGEPQLSMDDKGNFVWSDCTFLASYAESPTHVNILYYAPGPGMKKTDFFVERGRPSVRYHVGDNCIDGIRSFRTNQLLEPYLQNVMLNELD